MQEQYHIVGVAQTFRSRNAPKIRKTLDIQRTLDIQKTLVVQKKGDSQS